MKIGDIVKIDIEKASMGKNKNNEHKLPAWYSNKIYKIIGTHEKDSNVMVLNNTLASNFGNAIHVSYLKLLNTERKNKLLKINSI